MKRANKSLSKNYLTVKVFLEDLESIQAVLSDSRGFEIKTDDYEFSNVEELRSKYDNQKLNNVKISALDPYIQIDFNKLWVRLYCGSDEVTDAGIFYKLDSIISATSRKPNFLYSYYTFFLVNIILDIILYILPTPTIENKIALDIFVAPFILWMIWVFYIRLFNSGEVILAQRGNTKNFFSRNRDSIIVGVIVAVISVFLTTLATIYLPELHTALQLLSTK